MKYYLLQYSLSGIKSLNKKICINFYNSTIDKTINFNKNNIKAIYGENGSGKSAIVHGIELYKNIMSTNNEMNSMYSKKYYGEIINKETNEAYLEFIFSAKTKKEKADRIYKHMLIIGYDEFNNCIIKKEKFCKLNAIRRIKDENFEIIFESENGEIISNSLVKIDNDFSNMFVNTLDSNSFFMTFYKRLMRNQEFLKKVNDDEIKYLDILSGLLFSANMDYVNLINDNHYDYNMSKVASLIQNEISIKDLISQINTPTISFEKMFTRKVSKQNFDNYVSFIKRLEIFIKIFKTELVNIEIKTTEDIDNYYCELLFNYGKYKVSEEYESTGIKKLINLFGPFEKLYNGKILFVDEFDANLHDVYFSKLVEFMKNNAKGQLIMTTHNISLMENIKSNKYAIDFLSNESTLFSWKKNGNYKPSRLYMEGMIENSPFNIESFDYYKAFCYEEE